MNPLDISSVVGASRIRFDLLSTHGTPPIARYPDLPD